MTEKARIPEVIEPDRNLPPDLVALRRFAWLMDEAVAIPGTGRRVGVDAIVGLVPGIGDVIGALLSTWIIIGALRHRVPARRVLRMIFNVLLDVTIGAIPLLGDLFDFLFEENVMNLEILLRYRNRSLPPRRPAEMAVAAGFLLVGVGLCALALAAGVIAFIIWIVRFRA